MAKKTPKETKKARREARKQEREAIEQATREAVQRRKWILTAIAVATAGGAAALYQTGQDRALIGGALLGGIIAWLMVALSGIGQQVKPRDRGKAGSIDYGN